MFVTCIIHVTYVYLMYLVFLVGTVAGDCVLSPTHVGIQLTNNKLSRGSGTRGTTHINGF